ncbi:MAG: DUF4124 domain-containing protein [Betaproteobacteria bacterium]|nr:DUF4124 domain-containing protein [Betaproteobacteria bacterium]
MIERSALRGALLLALAVMLATPAWAQVLYKLVDRQGRVTYSDKEPKNYDGTVTRLEPDTASNIVPGAKPGENPPRAGTAGGIGETRRLAREDLDRKLRAAQARVDAARKALAGGSEPLPEELQTVQHRYPPLKAGENPPNPNCFAANDPSGVPSLNCPTRVPLDAFYERQKKLEDELKVAEEELALAERAYRRGTD